MFFRSKAFTQALLESNEGPRSDAEDTSLQRQSYQHPNHRQETFNKAQLNKDLSYQL